MSPVFRHGRLRLYLLKLLDEAPRHGYEVIRLLQDRFLGVYAPSPGTVYPRLARLEEEGLVTHDESNGRKVYRITGKGREELRSRLDDLTELEEELTASVRDIAREVSEDVRETVRALREEVTWAAREFHARARQTAPGAGQGPGDGEPAQAHHDAARAREAARAHADQARQAARAHADEAKEAARARAGHAREAAHTQADRARDSAQGTAGAAGDAAHTQADRGRAAAQAAGHGGWSDPQRYRDLERLARQFSRDLRAAAWQAQAVSEEALRDLRDILDETIGRIRAEVFRGTSPEPDSGDEPGDPGPPRPGSTS